MAFGDLPILSPVSLTDLSASPEGNGEEATQSLPANPSNGQVYPNRTKRVVGIILLMVTVLLWTASNFLSSTIFADNTYSKPYFVTYINTSFFSCFLLPTLVRYGVANGWFRIQQSSEAAIRNPSKQPRANDNETEAFLKPDEDDEDENLGSPTQSGVSDASIVRGDHRSPSISSDKLSLGATARLGLEFCMLWFAANYSIAAGLEYTTVGSSTILMSTSSVWTLLFGVLIKVETFSIRKLSGVVASLIGVVLVSMVDFSGTTDDDRGSFPHKSPSEIAAGDALSLGSAIIYGFYTIFMKRKIGDETRINIFLFFGFVGAFNTIILWPGFFLLHFTGIENFELPPTKRVWLIIIANSLTSLVADICWAFATLLTSPLVVTVGLSLSIPLSLVGQMILNSQRSSAVYWVGALIVLLSFVFINHEDNKREEEPDNLG